MENIRRDPWCFSINKSTSVSALPILQSFLHNGYTVLAVFNSHCALPYLSVSSTTRNSIWQLLFLLLHHFPKSLLDLSNRRAQSYNISQFLEHFLDYISFSNCCPIFYSPLEQNPSRVACAISSFPALSFSPQPSPVPLPGPPLHHTYSWQGHKHLQGAKCKI